MFPKDRFLNGITEADIGANAANSHFVRIVLVRYLRSEGRLSQISI
jgi:hypothetical protein